MRKGKGFIVLLLVWGICCISCNDAVTENVTVEEDVMLTLSLRMVGEKDVPDTRSISANKENELVLDQLKIWVFKVKDGSETFEYEAPQLKQQSGKYMVTLRQSRNAEAYRLVVIANAGTKLPYIPQGTSKAEALKQVTYNASGAWKAKNDNAGEYTPIPMWGETANAKMITEGTTLDNVTLLRALARVDVGCALNGEVASGLSNFTLKSVTIYRVKNKGYVAPFAGMVSSGKVTGVSIPTDAVGQNITYSETLGYAMDNGKSLIRSIYVAETPAGTDKDNAVCLVIGGTYAGSLNYYRVDLLNGSYYVPLKRNCRYVVNITGVSDIGYTTEAAALTGDKTLNVVTSVSANAWGTETSNGSGTITL